MSLIGWIAAKFKFWDGFDFFMAFLAVCVATGAGCAAVLAVYGTARVLFGAAG